MSAEPAAVASTVNATVRPASAAPSVLRVSVADSVVAAPALPVASWAVVEVAAAVAVRVPTALEAA